jgi:hypothetical protein
MENKTIAESTSLVEDFSSTSTFHASPEAAFPDPLDLALAPVLHTTSFSIEDYSYCWALAVISLVSIGSIDIILLKASNRNMSFAILAICLTDNQASVQID